jgi:hypothetical protein
VRIRSSRSRYWLSGWRSSTGRYCMVMPPDRRRNSLPH